MSTTNAFWSVRVISYVFRSYGTYRLGDTALSTWMHHIIDDSRLTFQSSAP